MLRAGLVEIGTQARALDPFDDGRGIFQRVVVVDMPDVDAGALARLAGGAVDDPQIDQ